MFSTGTQRKFWVFPNVEELEILRREANERFVKERADHKIYCLTPDEESIVRRQYEERLQRFCTAFQPQMPNSAIGTAMLYFKRLYLNRSVMELPVEDLMHSCIFLACKTDEFNVTMEQYVANISGACRDVESIGHDITSYELRLMGDLHFHLIVHTPYRQVEGLLIDIKTRCGDNIDAEKLRPGITAFLNRCLLSDALLLYPPSQIALAAIITSASNLGLNMALDSFIANKLLASGSYELRTKMATQLQNIRHLVRKVQDVNAKEFERVNSKLEACYGIFNIIAKSWRWRAEPSGDESSEDEGARFDSDESDM